MVRNVSLSNPNIDPTPNRNNEIDNISKFSGLHMLHKGKSPSEHRHYFGFSLPSELTERKRNKFVNNYNSMSLL